MTETTPSPSPVAVQQDDPGTSGADTDAVDNAAKPNLTQSLFGTAARLQASYLGQRDRSEQAEARAFLAGLRRAAGRRAADEPMLLHSVLAALTPPLSAKEQGSGDAPTPSESAAFAALTLFAWHMQSATVPMHTEKRSLGTAMGLLMSKRSSQSLKPRFDALQLARTERSRLQHARSLISLLRTESIALDYGRFAGDLRSLGGSRRQTVLLQWGRDLANQLQHSRSAPPTPAQS